MRGIIQVTGEPGVGKTSFALGYPVKSSKKIGVMNFDVKPYPIIDPKGEYGGYGFYRQYTAMLTDFTNANPELAMVEAVIADFPKLKGCDVVIFDAWEMFSKGLIPWTLRNAKNLKDWHGGGTILQMAKLGHASKVEVSFLDYIYSILGVDAIFIINHLGHEYGGEGVRTGRRIPQASERLNEKCSARFWLKHNPDHTCPIAVVLKDPGKHVFVPGRGVIPSRIFPDRLSPMAIKDSDGNNVSLWQIIDHYNERPVAARELEPFERLTQEEFAYVAGTMTPTQLAVAERNQKLALALGGKLEYDALDKMREIVDNGETSFINAFKQVREDYPELGMTDAKKMFDSIEK
jgi:hypothetical protein